MLQFTIYLYTLTQFSVAVNKLCVVRSGTGYPGKVINFLDSSSLLDTYYTKASDCGYAPTNQTADTLELFETTWPVNAPWPNEPVFQAIPQRGIGKELYANVRGPKQAVFIGYALQPYVCCVGGYVKDGYIYVWGDKPSNQYIYTASRGASCGDSQRFPINLNTGHPYVLTYPQFCLIEQFPNGTTTPGATISMIKNSVLNEYLFDNEEGIVDMNVDLNQAISVQTQSSIMLSLDTSVTNTKSWDLTVKVEAGFEGGTDFAKVKTSVSVETKHSGTESTTVNRAQQSTEIYSRTSTQSLSGTFTIPKGCKLLLAALGTTRIETTPITIDFPSFQFSQTINQIKVNTNLQGFSVRSGSCKGETAPVMQAQSLVVSAGLPNVELVNTKVILRVTSLNDCMMTLHAGIAVDSNGGVIKISPISNICTPKPGSGSPCNFISTGNTLGGVLDFKITQTSGYNVLPGQTMQGLILHNCPTTPTYGITVCAVGSLGC